MYHDDLVGSLYLQPDNRGRVYIHIDPVTKVTPAFVRRHRQVLAAIEDELRLRGVADLWTFNRTDGEVQYAALYGFELVEETLTVGDIVCNVMKKDL